MTTRVIETATDRLVLLRWLREHSLPMTVEVVKGVRRSVEQNKLMWLWISEIAQQMDETPEDVHAHVKLHIGVPILRAENELFREKYDRIVKPLSYEQKLEAMMEPLALPVTSQMTTKQLTRFLDAMYQSYTQHGVVLTDPERQAA